MITLTGAGLSGPSVGGGTTVFQDDFNQPSSELSLNVPDTGTGYTLLIQTTGDIETDGFGAAAANGSTSEGALYTLDATYSSADYSIEVTQTVSGSLDETNTLAVRVQDSSNMYAVLYNGDSSQLYSKMLGTWNTIGSSGLGVFDLSTAKLEIDGTTLRFLIDGLEELNETVIDHSMAGKAGIGMGAGINVGDDMASQEWADVVVIS